MVLLGGAIAAGLPRATRAQADEVIE